MHAWKIACFPRCAGGYTTTPPLPGHPVRVPTRGKLAGSAARNYCTVRDRRACLCRINELLMYYSPQLLPPGSGTHSAAPAGPGAAARRPPGHGRPPTRSLSGRRAQARIHGRSNSSPRRHRAGRGNLRLPPHGPRDPRPGRP